MLRKPYLYILAICFFCCEEAPDFGIEGGSIDAPNVTITTPDEATFENSSILIEWIGNPTTRIFDYRLEYVSTSASDNWKQENSWVVPPDNWAEQHSWPESDTTSATSVAFYNLDEGVYRFYINGRYDLDNIGNESILLFKVDAIPGPALRIYPLNQTADVGDEIDVYLYFEEVPEELAVTGLHVNIQINTDGNTDRLEFITDQFALGELMDGAPGTPIYPDPSYSEDKTSVSIIIGVIDDINQNGQGIYGTGSIAKFRLKVIAGSGTWNINIASDASYQDSNDNPIEGFSSPVNGSITVGETGP